VLCKKIDVVMDIVAQMGSPAQPALAQFVPAQFGPALCGPMAISCWAGPALWTDLSAQAWPNSHFIVLGWPNGATGP